MNATRKLRAVDPQNEHNLDLAKRLIKEKREKAKHDRHIVNQHSSEGDPEPTLPVDEILDDSFYQVKE